MATKKSVNNNTAIISRDTKGSGFTGYPAKDAVIIAYDVDAFVLGGGIINVLGHNVSAFNKDMKNNTAGISR